jgi:hypothetical protein
MRYEIPAMILVDAGSEEEAHTKALQLGATLDQEYGPGAFFSRVTTAVIEWPRASEGRDDETLAAHAESLQMAAGMQ